MPVKIPAVKPTLAEPQPGWPGGLPKYYPALDGYRAVAVLLVFSIHYVGQRLPILRNWGFLGVDLFFVLSGFLITGILYDSRHQPHRLRDFYARRVLRIFPLYYGVGLVLLLLWPIFRWHFEPGLLLWIGHLGNWARYLQYRPQVIYHLDLLMATHSRFGIVNIYFGHFWSLCVEEQFYLMWPFVVYLIPSRRRLMLLSASIVLLEPLLRLLLFFQLPRWLIENDILLRGTVFRLDALLLGGLIALLLRGPEAAWLHRHGRVLSCVGVLPLLAVIFEYRHRMHTVYANPHDISIATIGLSAAPLFGAALLLKLIRTGSPLTRIFSWTPLLRLGQVSYGFYVFHDLPHDLYNTLAAKLFGNHGHHGASAAIAFVCTTALSFLSFRYYETPFLRLKSRFSHQVHTAPAS